MLSQYNEPARRNKVYREASIWPSEESVYNAADIEEFVQEFMEKRSRRFFKSRTMDLKDE
jgi:hypothetical protein